MVFFNNVRRVNCIQIIAIPIYKCLTYFDATGDCKASELKSYLISRGVGDNIFFSSGNKKMPLFFKFDSTC